MRRPLFFKFNATQKTWVWVDYWDMWTTIWVKMPFSVFISKR
jgi:hypothetical protein